jgi:multiple sugar transport system ATP-binding protein
VIAGLRPAAFGDATVAGEDGSGERLPFLAVIDLVESMGSELYAHFEAAPAQRLVARLDAKSAVTAGEPARLSVDLAELGLFDAGNGRSLMAR